MPIRVIGYFPTVRVTNDETVKIRKVGYQGPAGRPASDFNFSELANVADSAAPTLGNIPRGDGALWQSVALTPALAGADPVGSAAAAQAAAQAFATSADNTVLSTAQGYANTAQTNAATRSDNASNLSTGTVPLGRLAGITNAQLSATAGILSSQIAGLDASKITGTFPLSLLNQGTTGQFLRGDGTYSNTLTGGLTIAGALAGATTGAFSGSVDMGSPLTFPAAGGYIQSNSSVGFDTGDLVLFGGGGGTTTRSGSIRIFGKDSATAPGSVWIRPCSTVGDVRVLTGAGGTLAQFTATGLAVTGNISATTFGPVASSGAVSGTTGTFSGAVTLSTVCKIIYGAAGTTTAANNEIVGAVGGLRYNVAGGLAHTLLVANTAALTLNSTSATFSGTLAATAATITTGSIRFSANNGGLIGSGSANQMRIGSGSTGISSSGASIALNGNTTTTLQGYLWLYAGQVAGGRILAIDETNAQQMEISSAGTTINKIILTANTPATATSTGTAGQIAWDSSGNIYICSATNTWRRVATSTF